MPWPTRTERRRQLLVRVLHALVVDHLRLVSVPQRPTRGSRAHQLHICVCVALRRCL